MVRERYYFHCQELLLHITSLSNFMCYYFVYTFGSSPSQIVSYHQDEHFAIAFPRSCRFTDGVLHSHHPTTKKLISIHAGCSGFVAKENWEAVAIDVPSSLQKALRQQNNR